MTAWYSNDVGRWIVDVVRRSGDRVIIKTRMRCFVGTHGWVEKCRILAVSVDDVKPRGKVKPW